MKKDHLLSAFLKKYEQKIIILMLGLLMVNFFGFGLYHLTKFETVDEHFWKYKRIGKYWEGVKLGLKDGHWKKTHINDKPGVTVAILSGVGLIFEPNPELHRNRDPKDTDNENYTIYRQEQTERLNFLFRFPILLFSTLILPLFYWLIKQFANKKIALLSTIFISTSPILIGMSQIINPDALLWSFAGLAVFSFFALLKRQKREFLLLACLFSGLALLSKYTANILFPFFLMVIFSKAYFDETISNSKTTFNLYLKKQFNNFLIVFISSSLIFIFFLPAIFEKAKYLYEGTVGSPASEAYLFPFWSFIVFWAVDSYVFKNVILYFVISQLRRFRKLIFVGIFILFTSLLLLILINPHLSSPIIPLEDVKEDTFIDGDMVFPQLQDYNYLSRGIAMYSIEVQPFLFSLTPVVLIGLMFLLILRIIKNKKQTLYDLYAFILVLFIAVYFGGNLFSGVLVNPRYAIMLYPIVYFLSAIGVWELLKKCKQAEVHYLPIFVLIILLGVFSLWKIKPFYLNYENILLPKKFVLTDAWGYGEYEAAQYLNSLDNSDELVIWSDRSAIYQFIKGKGIRDYKIDLEKTVPQYFVFSRRGSIRHKFRWKKPELAPNDRDYYYQDGIEDIVWQLNIGGRNKNYVRIVRVDY